MNSKLTPPDAFTFMVDKGLFRIGVDIICPNCGMTSWVAVDVLKQRLACELCGHEYDATRQLIPAGWRFRRSGVLGAERNAQGAVPVALTLQQLDANLHGLMHHGVYSASLDLIPKPGQLTQPCEIDFVWLLGGQYPSRPVIILGSAKTKGQSSQKSFNETLKICAGLQMPSLESLFETYILFTKMASFTTEEIAMARTLNGQHEQRVILLTARELEPYHILDWTKQDYPAIKSYAGSPADLASVTAQLYFSNEPPPSVAG